MPIPPHCQGSQAESSWKEGAECLCSVYHPWFGISSAAGALSIRSLSIYKLTNFHVDCKAGNVYTCHSYSWPKCFLPAALTMGRWHHSLVIVWRAIDTRGFRRMHNLIIRPHLQSNHELHYEENVSECRRCNCLIFDFPYSSKDCVKSCWYAKPLGIFFNIMSIS